MTLDSKGADIPGSPWSPIDTIQQDIFFKNKNRLILIVGDPRTGKSLAACRIGERVNPARFTASSLRWFLAMGSARKFMDVCNAKYLREGDVVIFDEAGIGVSSRNWFSEFNKAVNFVMQIFGFKRLCVIMTVPRSKMIDSQVRSIFSDVIETHGIDYSTCLNSVRWMRIITDNIYQKTMHHYFRHDKKVYTTIKIGLPTRALLAEYLRLEKIAKPEVMLKMSAQLNKAMANDRLDRSNMHQVVDVLKTVTTNYQRYVTFDNSGRINGIDTDKLNADFKLDKEVMAKVQTALGKELTTIQSKEMETKEVLKSANVKVAV